jgi:hypothetical protein
VPSPTVAWACLPLREEWLHLGKGARCPPGNLARLREREAADGKDMPTRAWAMAPTRQYKPPSSYHKPVPYWLANPAVAMMHSNRRTLLRA